MTDINLSAVLYGKDDLRMEERPIPEPEEGEVQIKIHSVGVCGTDIHYWKSGYVCTKDHPITTPRILGHETSGVISKLGPGVTGYKLGDRVCLEPMSACLKCEFCKIGKQQICPSTVLWNPDGCGHYARFCTQPAQYLYRLPDHLSFEEGALLEPMVVGVYACDRADIAPGKSVLIVGAGPVGLVTAIAAKAAGATQIAIVDLVKNRVEFAKTLGVTHGFVLEKGVSEKETVEKITQALGDMPDSTIDCSGSEGGIRLGILATKSGGVLALAGLAPAEAKLPLVNAAVREVDIRPVFRYGHAYKRTLKMMAAGQIDMKPLIGQQFPLEKTPEAMETFFKGANGKLIVQCFRD